MRYSTNLNIILRAIAAATNHIPRDITELENLQTNPVSANKFALACCAKIKKILRQEFEKFRPDFDLYFCDGEVVRRKSTVNSEYCLLINFIDGFENLKRASGDFVVSIALQHLDKNGKYQDLAAAICKVIGNEMYYSEKGFGCYLNNRRLRIAKRDGKKLLVATENPRFLFRNFLNQDQERNQKKIPEKIPEKVPEKVPEKKQESNMEENQDLSPNFCFRLLGSKTLEISYLAASRLDRIYISAFDLEENFNKKLGSIGLEIAKSKSNEPFFVFVSPFLLLVRESGGLITDFSATKNESESAIVILTKNHAN